MYSLALKFNFIKPNFEIKNSSSSLDTQLTNLSTKTNTKYSIWYQLGLLSKMHFGINFMHKVNTNVDSQLYSSKLEVGVHGTPKQHPLHEYFSQTINGEKVYAPSAIFTLKDKISTDPLTSDTRLACANEFVWDVSNTAFCNNTMSGHHINPIIEDKANSYSILSPAGGDIDNNGKPLNTITTLIKNQGTGNKFAQMQIGDTIAVAGVVSNYFACPEYKYPMISICMGSGCVPAVSMAQTRISDAKKNNQKPAPHLIITSFQNENNSYGLLEKLKILASDKDNNIILINNFSKQDDFKHLFSKHKNDFSIDTTKYSLHEQKNFKLILKFLYMKDIHVRLSSYFGVDEQLLHYLKTMGQPLPKFMYKNITKRFEDLQKIQYIRAEGTAGKDVQSNGHIALS